MNKAEACVCCLEKPGAFECYPFDEHTKVIKVVSKMFALFTDTGISLKCDPILSGNLRGQYPDITPGYHLNKEHWITVRLDGGAVPEKTVRALIDLSYELVTKKNKKRKSPSKQTDSK